MKSRPASAKSLSIKTKNMDFPNVGTVIELYDEEAVVKLADGSLTYAYFTSAERDAMAKSVVKLQVGSVVNVAVQRNEARKIIQTRSAAGDAIEIKMFPILIQEVQPVYLDKGVIVEVESDYVKVKVEKTSAVEMVVFSVAQKQLMQESNLSFFVGQAVNVNTRKVPVYGSAIDIQAIASPEPQTAYVISPKVGSESSPPVVLPPPQFDQRTALSFMIGINSPDGARSPTAKVKPVVRTEAPVVKAEAPKPKQLLRRYTSINPNSLLPIAASPAMMPVSDMIMPTRPPKRDVLSAERVSREPVKSNRSLGMFPSLGVPDHASSPVMPAITSIKAIDHTAYHNEMYQVLKAAIVALKPLATTKDDILLMKNLSFALRSVMPVSQKIQSIIAQVKQHNPWNFSNLRIGFHTSIHSTLPFNTIAGFAKLTAKLELEKKDEQLLSLLKLMVPALPSVSAKQEMKSSGTLPRLQ